MPIYEILRRQGVFAPDEVAMLGKVFEDVLRTLGLVDRKDPMTEMVAKKLVDLATAGMRDPDRLRPSRFGRSLSNSNNSGKFSESPPGGCLGH